MIQPRVLKQNLEHTLSLIYLINNDLIKEIESTLKDHLIYVPHCAEETLEDALAGFKKFTDS